MAATTAAAVTPDILANALGVSHETLWKRIRQGKCPSFIKAEPQRDNRRFWDLAVIRAWRPDVADRAEWILQAPPLKTPV